MARSAPVRHTKTRTARARPAPVEIEEEIEEETAPDRVLAMLDDLSAAELNAVIARASGLRDSKIVVARRELIEEVNGKLAALGLSHSDLAPAAAKRGRVATTGSGKSRTPAAVKYRDGEHEWSGRGRMSGHFAQLVAAGHKIEEYLVDKSR